MCPQCFPLEPREGNLSTLGYLGVPPMFSTEPREGNLSLNSWVLGCAPSVFHFDFESQEGKLTLGYLGVPPVFSTEPREGN